MSAAIAQGTEVSPMSPEDLVLETDRLILHPLTLDDLDLATALLTNLDVMKYVCDIFTPEDIRDHRPVEVKRAAGGGSAFGQPRAKARARRSAAAFCCPCWWRQTTPIGPRWSKIAIGTQRSRWVTCCCPRLGDRDSRQRFAPFCCALVPRIRRWMRSRRRRIRTMPDQCGCSGNVVCLIKDCAAPMRRNAPVSA